LTDPLPAAEIRALAGLLDELDYYQILELPADAPASAIKRAYYEATRRLHPDKNRGLQGEDRLALERVAKRISEAYQVLRDGRRRKVYDSQLRGEDGDSRLQLVEAVARAERQTADDHLGKTPNGRRFFNLARSDIDRGELQAATRNLKMAMTFEPTNEYFKKKLDEISAALKG
jgi:DnaJ-class molecular chaperone